VPGNVVLVGFSGTGKSSVGRRLAERLGRPFVDTDERLIARFGAPIGDVFRTHGEAVFRVAEAEEVRRACAANGLVVALGGGAIVADDSFEAARAGNLLVRLRAPIDVTYRRLVDAPGAEERPMLSGDRPKERMSSLLASREARYAQADVTIDTGELGVDDIVERIITLVEAPWPR
jgi:shikimate kinase